MHVKGIAGINGTTIMGFLQTKESKNNSLIFFYFVAFNLYYF